MPMALLRRVAEGHAPRSISLLLKNAALLEFDTLAVRSFSSATQKSSRSTGCSGGAAAALRPGTLAPRPTLAHPRAYSGLSDAKSRAQAAWKSVAGAASPSRLPSLLPASARSLLDSLSHPSSLQRAVSLQLEAAWQRHRRKALGAAAIALAYFVWRAMRRTASAFVDVSQSLAATGLVSLTAAASVAAAAWLYRRHFVISPAAVYRAAMLRLNTHPGALEVMGAPVVGSDVRASVLTGGGLKFKGLRPKLRSRRVAMIFPLKGTERRGLVSVEAKKKGGKLKMTLLAVDVPMPAALGGEQRIFVEGGPKAYARGGVLDELRRPFLAALTSEEAVEAEEDAEEEREARAAAVEAEVREGEAAAAAAAVVAPRGPSPTEIFSKAAASARDFISRVQRITTKQ